MVLPTIHITSPEGEDIVDNLKPDPKAKDRRPLGDLTNRVAPRVHGKTPACTRSSVFRKPNPRELQRAGGVEGAAAQQKKATLRVPHLPPGNPSFTPVKKADLAPLVIAVDPASLVSVDAPASPEWHELKAKPLNDACTRNKYILEKEDRRRSLPTTISEKDIVNPPALLRRTSVPVYPSPHGVSLSARLCRAFSWTPGNKNPADLEAQSDLWTSPSLPRISTGARSFPWMTTSPESPLQSYPPPSFRHRQLMARFSHLLLLSVPDVLGLNPRVMLAFGYGRHAIMEWAPASM
ncbi:hypothetical protein B0H17DRAFT_1205641 [Mycena rosella]|uniref:Uncharacterized protein n=1 Tax=Mycena rosella TaxID=1033263 RepID=A0AAD7D6L7_MYCRO|nr:hypothetical protein B0H17DRAFT_1205641 [Mycena rosella]